MFKKLWIFFCTLNLLILTSTSALADLILADGGASGQWFNLSRDGEGIYFEIVDGGTVSVAWFTYDMDGNQMWLSGAIDISDSATSVAIPVSVTDGPVFGPDYDPDDLNSELWGTLTLNFPDCDTGLLSYASSTGFGQDTISLIRLTDLEQVRCTEPPPTPTITPGRWTGEGVCFYVGPDGDRITELDSTCDGGQAFDSNLDGISSEGEDCGAEVECEGGWAIVDGAFYCTSSNEIAVGSFISDSEAAGLAQESEGPFDATCTAAWTATPD
jgi:hypothetical protein